MIEVIDPDGHGPDNQLADAAGIGSGGAEADGVLPIEATRSNAAGQNTERG